MGVLQSCQSINSFLYTCHQGGARDAHACMHAYMQVVILVGDFSYADNYAEDGSSSPRLVPTTFPPRWDAWGRLIQPLASQVGSTQVRI